MSVPADKTEILAACARAVEQHVAIVLLPQRDLELLIGMLDPVAPSEQRMAGMLQQLYRGMYGLEDDGDERSTSET